MNVLHLISFFSLLVLVHGDAFDVTMIDLNTKANKYDGFLKCNMNFGEIIYMKITWTIDDGQAWNKPVLNIKDPTYIFASKSQQGTLSYYICKGKTTYVTTLIACNIELQPGSYTFGLTLTARQARPKETSFSGNIEFHMNQGSPRDNNNPSYSISLTLPK